MTDSSWDNGGYAQPPKSGMPTWLKVLLGCGVVAVLAMATCVGGAVYLTHRIKKNPEAFKNQVLGFAIEKMRPEWEDFRKVVDQLRTQDGCRALYAANPGLAKNWPREADFLEAAKAWQPTLPPAPELTPEVLETHGIQINHVFGGSVKVSWRPRKGPSVTVTFDRARRDMDTSPRQVLDVEVH